jgi:TctA family transporter
MEWFSSFLSAEGAAAAAAGKAFWIMMDPTRLGFLALGAVLGLLLGIIPGIGGLAGTTILLPFTFAMDPYTAFAFLLGLGATTATGDPIPAILFGVPGGAASAATVLDGYPMSKRGEAGRALSAAYMSSMLGGIFGAALLAVAIPVLRPVILFLGTPELLAFGILGISMVAVLSGSAPLRGLAAGCLGIMLAMVGSDPQLGQRRWTFDFLYLWDGLPLQPMLLGIFALPELCDLVIGRMAISAPIKDYNVYKGQWQGVKDCMRHWWLIVRCSWIGGGIGSIPGISAAVVDWLAYGHALRTEKGAAQTFGRGDVRGVIASESSNNAKEGGALVPTVAFGIPGSSTMAILLGAFTMHGLVPGPKMLTEQLDFTFAMVWSVALANILGAGMCFALSPQFARVALLRYTLICPAVLGIIYLGAFEATRSWGDLYVLLAAGVVGWTMKQLKWPRVPLVLGFVLGDQIERYFWITTSIYGWSWLLRPVTAIVVLLAVVGLVRPFIQDVRLQGGLKGMLSGFGWPRFQPAQLLTLLFVATIGTMVWQATAWRYGSKAAPLFVGIIALVALAISAINEVFRKPSLAGGGTLAEQAQRGVTQKIHMDIAPGTEALPVATIIGRAAVFFGYLVGFLGVMAVIGLIPTAFVFIIAFMRIEARERWQLTLVYAACATLFIYCVFDRLLHLPWPPTLLGEWVPWLRGYVPSL